MKNMKSKSNKDIEILIKKILNEEIKNLNEGEWEEKNKPEEASTWEKIKYTTSLMTGRYKVNGKFWGKGKEFKAAEEEIKKLIDKQGNEFIKELDNSIQERNPEFPNNLKGSDFLSIVLDIAACYDSIVDAAKKQKITIDSANGVINDLRAYVKHILDAKLKAVYSTVDENDNITEEEYKKIDEAFGLLEDQASDIRAKFKADRAARSGDGDNADFGSSKIKTLSKDRLSTYLLAGSVGLNTLSWMFKSEWFLNWIKDLFSHAETTTTADIFKNISGGHADARGMLHWMGKIDGHEMKTGADVQKFIGKYGADNVKHMFDGNGGGTPDEQIKQLQQVVGGENASKPVGQIFTEKNVTYGSMKHGQNLFGISKAASLVSRILIKKGITTTTKVGGAAAAAKVAGAASILHGVGIAALVAGATVKAMRMKGLRTSRAATLNSLYQSLRNIPGGTVIKTKGEVDTNVKISPSEINPGPVNKEAPVDTTKIKKEKEKEIVPSEQDDLYASLKKLFKYISDNKSKLSASPKKEKTSPEEKISKKKTKEVPKETPKDISTEEPVIKKGAVYTLINRSGKPFQIKVKNIDKEEGMIQIERTDGVKSKNPFIMKKALLKGIKKAKELKKSGLSEAFIKNIEVKKELTSAGSKVNLSFFEDLLKLIENVKKKLKKEKRTKDDRFNKLLNKFEDNYIMDVDFTNFFDTEDIKYLKSLIDDVYSSVYSGKDGESSFTKRIADILEATKEQQKDSTSKYIFKSNLLNFLRDALKLFKYMHDNKVSK